MIVVEPALCMLTVRPPAPPILATVGSLLVNVNGSPLYMVVGSVKSNAASAYTLSDGTVKLLSAAITTRDALTLEPPV